MAVTVEPQLFLATSKLHSLKRRCDVFHLVHSAVYLMSVVECFMLMHCVVYRRSEKCSVSLRMRL